MDRGFVTHKDGDAVTHGYHGSETEAAPSCVILENEQRIVWVVQRRQHNKRDPDGGPADDME